MPRIAPAFALLLLASAAVAAERVPWVGNKVVGSPEPPPPYTPARVFPNARFNHPLLVVRMPGSDRLFVGEQDGRIFSVSAAHRDAKPDLFCDLKADFKKLHELKDAAAFESVYGLVFHPNFAENRTCFVCYTLKGKKGTVGPYNLETNLPDGTRVSKFTVTAKDGAAPVLDVASEQVVISFLQGGHNGGDLHFGQDGCLYVSTGDSASPNPPDPFKTGQDCSDLLASVLRLDVDHIPDGKGQGYSVPKDNPFVGVTHEGKAVRPEVWSFGFRNPWRMGFDRKTGDLWVGDVGWEAWEMVHKTGKGMNHGWSVTEARQPVNTAHKLGPTAVITPPVIELDHSQAASVTGGYVYRGKKFPELVGKYVFGDYMTKRLWAATISGDRCTALVDLTDPLIRVTAFGEDADGELYFVDYDSGTVHTLAKNDKPGHDPKAFPTTLKATGLFADVPKHELAKGVQKFEVAAGMWNDGATAERFLAIPGTGAVKQFEERQKLGYVDWLPFTLVFPKDSVLGRTVTLDVEGKKAKRIETQLLHYDGAFWQAYTYAWREDQTDADLVPADGDEKRLLVPDPRVPGGVRAQTWSFASRTQCLTCHTPWAEVTLAFNPDQLNRPVKANGQERNQLAALCESGLLERVKKDGKPQAAYTDATTAKLPKLTDPYDDKAKLDDRARSYLHVNCSHCHRNGGGGSVTFELTRGADLTKGVIDAKPTRGDFGIPEAKIISSKEPLCSTLLFRMAKFGRDRMPHIGSELPDPQGVQLMWQWMKGAGKGGIAFEYSVKYRSSVIVSHVGNDPLFVLLADVISECKPSGTFSEAFLKKLAVYPPGPARDLFIGYFPPDGKEQTLGQNPRPRMILSLKGDAEKGKALFLNAQTKCVDCHKSGAAGKEVGPDLSAIGKERTRDDLLESILLPFRRVEAKYQAYTLKSEDGRSFSGVLVKKDAAGVTIRDAQGKDVTVDAKNVDQFTPNRESLMPSGLLADLTPQQAADLLEFLVQSKEKK